MDPLAAPTPTLSQGPFHPPAGWAVPSLGTLELGPVLSAGRGLEVGTGDPPNIKNVLQAYPTWYAGAVDTLLDHASAPA